MRILVVSVVSVLVLALVADLWLVRRVEHRIAERLGCRLDVDATVDIAWWRGLPALVAGEVGTVRLAVPLDELGAGRDLAVSGDAGRIVVEQEQMGAAAVVEPRVSDGAITLEVVGIRVGGREVGGLLAQVRSERISTGALGGGLGLGDLPDAVELTGVDVAADDLVVEAEVDPDGLDDQARAGCS